MDYKEIPEKYKKYIKGYVKLRGNGTIQTYFAIDSDGDYLIYGIGQDSYFEIESYDNKYFNDRINELIEIVPELPVHLYLAYDIEFMIDKETFESDLFQAIYNKPID